MDALMICAALAAVVATAALLWFWRRSRSDQRLQWLGTRERDWSTEELDALRATDAAA
jgi:hypothetical protein